MNDDPDPERPPPPVSHRDRARSALGRLVRHLLRPSVRLGLLVTVGYVTALAGLALSLNGDPGDPQGVYGVTGIGLMGIAFACLFVVSIGLLRRGGSRERGRGPRYR